jgi:hypothetical protein
LAAHDRKVLAMKSRQQKIEAEANALWRELYQEAPPAAAEGGEMLSLMLSRLPDVGYERLSSPFLRRSKLSSWNGR